MTIASPEHTEIEAPLAALGIETPMALVHRLLAFDGVEPYDPKAWRWDAVTESYIRDGIRTLTTGRNVWYVKWLGGRWVYTEAASKGVWFEVFDDPKRNRPDQALDALAIVGYRTRDERSIRAQLKLFTAERDARVAAAKGA